MIYFSDSCMGILWNFHLNLYRHVPIGFVNRDKLFFRTFPQSKVPYPLCRVDGGGVGVLSLIQGQLTRMGLT